jgi:hypothetical protein
MWRNRKQRRFWQVRNFLYCNSSGSLNKLESDQGNVKPYREYWVVDTLRLWKTVDTNSNAGMSLLRMRKSDFSFRYDYLSEGSTT